MERTRRIIPSPERRLVGSFVLLWLVFRGIPVTKSFVPRRHPPCRCRTRIPHPTSLPSSDLPSVQRGRTNDGFMSTFGRRRTTAHCRPTTSLAWASPLRGGVDDDDYDDHHGDDDGMASAARASGFAVPSSVSTTATSTDTATDSTETRVEERRKRSWILLVDDEEAIRTAVGRLLRDRGYGDVSTCEGGSEALQMARSRAVVAITETTETATSYDPAVDGTDPDGGEGMLSSIRSSSTTRGSRIPDCIVSDIRMPGMDGLELLQRIRMDPLLGPVPVVLLTAKGLTRDRIAGYDSGADAYLSKPFAPDELVAIVDSVIERYDAVLYNADGRIGRGNGDDDVTIRVDDLKRDVDEIKNLLLNKGGGGIGNGWVQQTNVFLSKEEQEVLELLAQGLMTKEIAARTYLSTRRIEQLLTRMFRKTGSRNRTELVRWAVSTGNVE